MISFPLTEMRSCHFQGNVGHYLGEFTLLPCAQSAQSPMPILSLLGMAHSILMSSRSGSPIVEIQCPTPPNYCPLSLATWDWISRFLCALTHCPQDPVDISPHSSHLGPLSQVLLSYHNCFSMATPSLVLQFFFI